MRAMKLIGMLLLLGSYASAWAQVAGVAITNAKIVDETGIVQENITIIMQHGVVQAIGSDLPIDDEMDVVDAQGNWVTSGFVAASGHLGLVEVGAVTDSVDTATQHRQLTAGFKVVDAFNSQSSLIAIARTEGLTSALIMPSIRNNGDEGSYANVFAGTAALVDLSGDFRSVRVAEAGVVASLGDDGKDAAGGSRAAAVAGLRAGLDAGRIYAESADEVSGFELPEALEDAPFSPADLRQFAKVVTGELPLIVSVDRASEILRVIDLVEEYSIRAVIMGGAEAWRVAGPLADAGIGVILNGENNLPLSFDHMGARLDSAAILAKAGVQIAFSGENASTHNARNMRQVAGLAVAHGLPWHEAIKALTLSAAGLLDLESDVGRLQAGALADLVVWGGDPLELMTYPTQVWIDGQLQDLGNRQTRLRDRYLDLNDPMPHAYR